MKRKKIGLFVLLSVILFGYAGTVDYTEAVVYYVENQEELNLFYKFAMNE